jgi:hypothetical protein
MITISLKVSDVNGFYITGCKLWLIYFAICDQFTPLCQKDGAVSIMPWLWRHNVHGVITGKDWNILQWRWVTMGGIAAESQLRCCEQVKHSCGVPMEQCGKAEKMQRFFFSWQRVQTGSWFHISTMCRRSSSAPLGTPAIYRRHGYKNTKKSGPYRDVKNARVKILDIMIKIIKEIATINPSLIDKNWPHKYPVHWYRCRYRVIKKSAQTHMQDAPGRAKRLVRQGDVVISMVRSMFLVSSPAAKIGQSTRFAALRLKVEILSCPLIS